MFWVYYYTGWQFALNFVNFEKRLFGVILASNIVYKQLKCIFGTLEFLGNLLTQTNKTKQTKQMFIRLLWMVGKKVIQSDEQNKRSTNILNSK